ncbi:hypothetical protein B0T26DRAFT_677636 [Lasiosphaeria miniovina]|uniref:F-box domain-containing protein n=1 Tax=Lasiosphaeria miniovina TaxID=1954250 RepID=A0AA40DRA9_9PEZI|nr:uncharacterized protein B0T26DRAFT_677636 [Lasiosphaeria miniovina]KAK0713284.1 hypothetical protein B0T26DRAFT_677636 [Lasiosphaeria miniovina]
MAGFTQPDEGYSEDPLTVLSASASFLLKPRVDAVSALGSVRSGDEFPAWLTQHISHLPMSRKTELAMAILSDLPTSVISQIVEQLNPRLYIDFVRHLPAEICLKILGYLDPVSLINVARSCRTWHDLALDRKLWEQLYYMEGWKAKPAEIEAWERRINGDLPTLGQLHRVQSEEYGHTHKKRTVAATPEPDVDTDMVMADAESPAKQDPVDQDMTGSSLFGNPTAAGQTGISQKTNDSDMFNGGSRSSSKGKGVNQANLSADPSHIRDELLRDLMRSQGLLKSTMWVWDETDQRFKINWKYLYTIRRRLESNWELGKFTNFQFPHPDHPEEGHGDCIYSLQYNSQYLVSGSRDRKLKIWDMDTRRCIRTLAKHRGSVLCLQFDSDPQEDIIVSGSSDSDVIIWSFSTGKELQTLRHAHRESVLNVRFDKRIVVTCSKDKTIKVFNRRPLRYGDLGYKEVDPVPKNVNFGFNFNIIPDDLPLTPAWTMIGSLEGHGAAVNAVQIHDREVVSASGDRHVKVWDWPTQSCTRTFVGHQKGIACVQYDGRRIVSGSSDNEVKVFDRQTGLEVARLRAHSNLVRTVQAGFGDMPYSVEDDAAEAKKVDAEYFKALESGRLDESERPGARPYGNAGSRRPEDICVYGAKLPPGGGGGKYGRIVSGSYDTSIIIWRRDKEGIWKDQHHLKQEEAAVAALRQARIPAPLVPSTAVGNIPLYPSMQPNIMLPNASWAPGAPPASGTAGAGPSAANSTTRTQSHYHQIIDIAVQEGQQSLSRALVAHPAILTLRSYAERAIDSQPSPVVRSQLRQAFSAMLIRAQFEQARQRREAIRMQESMAPADATAMAGPSTRTATATQPPPQLTPAMAAVVEAAAAHQAHAQHAPTHGVRLHQVPSPTSTCLENVQPSSEHHLPVRQSFHGREGVNTAFVFKLQYDARRIICCSQTSVIIGWDFCNADPELEEASQFFATVQ